MRCLIFRCPCCAEKSGPDPLVSGDHLRDSGHSLAAHVKLQEEGLESLNDLERARLHIHLAALIERIDNVLKQRTLGFIDDDFFERFDDQIKNAMETRARSGKTSVTSRAFGRVCERSRTDPQ